MAAVIFALASSKVVPVSSITSCAELANKERTVSPTATPLLPPAVGFTAKPIRIDYLYSKNPILELSDR
jgi:hypothetical protein